MFTKLSADLLAIGVVAAGCVLQHFSSRHKNPRRSEVFCTARILVFTKLFADLLDPVLSQLAATSSVNELMFTQFFPDLLAIVIVAAGCGFRQRQKNPRCLHRAGFFRSQTRKLSAYPVSRESAGHRCCRSWLRSSRRIASIKKPTLRNNVGSSR